MQHANAYSLEEKHQFLIALNHYGIKYETDLTPFKTQEQNVSKTEKTILTLLETRIQTILPEGKEYIGRKS